MGSRGDIWRSCLCEGSEVHKHTDKVQVFFSVFLLRGGRSEDDVAGLNARLARDINHLVIYFSPFGLSEVHVGRKQGGEVQYNN